MALRCSEGTACVPSSSAEATPSEQKPGPGLPPPQEMQPECARRFPWDPSAQGLAKEVRKHQKPLTS